MPAKINVISIFLYTRGHGRTKFFQNSDGPETTKKQTSFVAQPSKYFKNTIFLHKTFATTIVETAPPNCARPLRVSLKFIELESTFHILLFHSLVSHQQ